MTAQDNSGAIPADVWELARSLRTAVIWESNSAVEVIASLIVAERAKAWRLGYLAGFKASGEGWNGEYPFEGKDPEADAHWVETRDRAA